MSSLCTRPIWFAGCRAGASSPAGSRDARRPTAHMGEHVLGPLVTGTEPYVKDSRIALADGDFVVGLLRGGLPTKSGDRYDQFYLQLFRLQDRLIVEIVEIFDTVMVERALMGHRLATPRRWPARRSTLQLRLHWGVPGTRHSSWRRHWERRSPLTNRNGLRGFCPKSRWFEWSAPLPARADGTALSPSMRCWPGACRMSGPYAPTPTRRPAHALGEAIL